MSKKLLFIVVLISNVGLFAQETNYKQDVLLYLERNDTTKQYSNNEEVKLALTVNHHNDGSFFYNLLTTKIVISSKRAISRLALEASETWSRDLHQSIIYTLTTKARLCNSESC